MMQILGFSAPVRFRGHFQEIGIAKVLLNTKPRRVGKFRDVGFPTTEKVWRERKRNEETKLSAKYNGSLALATQERATIKSYTRKMAIANKTCVSGKN